MDQNYFAKKLAVLQDASPKQKNVYEAFQEKMQALEAYSNQLAETKRQDDLAYPDTTVGRLGLDPNDDPTLHTLVNTAARAGATGSRIIGQVASGLEGVAKEGFGTGGIDEDVRAARARQLNGDATPADIALLNYAPRTMSGVKNDQTNLDRIKHWEKTQEDLAKTKEFFNVDNRVDRRVDRPFQEELKQGAAQAGAEFEKDNYLTGAGILAKNVVSAGVNNPMGAFNALVENSPQLAAGIVFGLPGTLAVGGAYANDAYNEAIAEYRKKNNGAMPPKEKRNELLLQAAALMAAESASDRLTLGAGKAISAGIKGAQKAVDEVGEGVLKTALGIGTKTASSTPVSTAIGGVIGAAGEYGTETFQTVVENRMKDKETSLEKAHLSGAMGAWGGGPVAAAATAAEKLGEKADQYKEGRAKAAIELAKQEARAAEIKAATETGNIEVFLDRNTPDYSPDKALGVLQNLYESESTTPEKKAELVPKASEVMNDFGLQIEAIKSQLAGVEGAKSDLADAEKLLLAADPADTQRVADLTEYVADLKAMVTDGDLAPEVRAAKEQQLADLEAKYKTADVLYTEMSRKSVSNSFKDMDVDTEIASGSPESISKLKLLAMASPETGDGSLSIDQARTLASSTNPNVTVDDKKFFTAYADSLMKVKPLETMGKVAQEVLYGSKERDQKGLLDYRERFGLFMAQGNTAKADKELADLALFENNQKNKVDAITAAVKQFNQTSEAQIVAKTSDGTWAVIPKKADPTYKRKAGEYVIEDGGKANSLLRGATASLEAIQATSVFLESYKTLGKDAPNSAVTSSAPTNAVTPAALPAPAPAAMVNPPAAKPAASNAPVSAAPVGEQLRSTLQAAARETRFGAVQDPIAQSVVTSASFDKLAEQLPSMGVSAVSGVLGAGASSVVLDTPEGALRIGFGSDEALPKSSSVIAPIQSGEVGGLRYQLMPKADTSNITDADVQSVSKALAIDGLTLTDPGTDNIGRVEGKLVVIDPGAVEVAKPAPAGIVLPVTGKYTPKDQEKANKASKFIGRGAPGSSTDVYAKAYGNLANSGTYTAKDVVFVSVNGSRADRVEANYDEIGLAMEAGATILTDKQADRDRPYNKVGEGAVAGYLATNGYVEVKPGEWVPASKAPNQSKATSSIAKVISAISKKYPDRNISEPTQEQSAVIASALKEVVAALGDDFAYPNHIVIFEHPSTKGVFFYEENSLGLNKSLFDSGLASFGITDPVQAVKVIIAHEMAHGRDQGAAFPSQQAKSLREGGVFYREAKAVVDAGEAHPLYLWYKNVVFRASNNGDTIASELYAQMFTLYAVNKELLQEHLPKTYEKVTQAIEKSSAQNQRREAAEVVRAVYDGGRDTAVSEESKPQEQATEGPRVSGVEAEAQEQVEQVEVESEASAKLAALKDATNRASKWLKQAVTRKANAKNQSLLTAIPDLFSTLVSDGNLNRIAEFLPDGLMDSDNETLGKVQALYGKLAPMMQARLRVAHPSKRENTFLDDLLITKDGKIDLDENLKIALTMGGLAYLRDAMDAGLYHDKETINKILGQPKEAKIPSKVVAELGLGYSRYNLVANNIGESVMKSLGIKAQKDAPENYLANMQAALGALALETMQEAGYLTVKEIRDGELQSWYGKTSSEPYMTHKFVSVAFGPVKGKDGNKRNDWMPKAKALHQEFKGETSNLAQMFDVQSQLQMPSFDPPGFNQKSIKRSTRSVPKRLADYLRKVTNTPYTLKKESYRFLANLDAGLAYELIGVDTRPVSEIHQDNQMSVEAKNDGLIRGYEMLQDFVTNGIENHEKGWDAEVYFPQDVWNNQRVGVKSAINMQTDKLHRYMFTTKAWETKIEKNDFAAIGKFKLRVLEGFGVKTDSKTAEDALTVDWNALEDNKVVQAGVAVLQEQLRDPNFFADADQQKAVLAAVKVSDTNAHALDAMLGYAAYKNMEASGADNFTTNMVGEIDGVNNGPILTLFFLGVSNIAQYAEKGGFFKLGSAVRNANVWKANKKNLDIYQTATNTFLESFATTMSVDSSYKSLEYFTGDLGKMGAITSAGRNLAKRPNTAFFFGSGKGSLVSGLQEEFVSKVLGKIEEVAAIKETDAQEKARKELIRNLNSLLPPEVHVAPDTNVEGLMKLRIAEGTIGRSLENIFAKKIGKPFASTLAGSYGEVTQLRNLITQESEVMYSIYSHVYAEMKEAMIQDLVQKGEITPEQAKNWDITEGMASELKAILKDLEPVVHSVQSKKDGDAGLGTALPVVKQKTNASDNPKYERTVFFTNKEGKEQKRTVRAMEKGFKEPGVGMLAKTVHSSDSGISHSTNPEFGAVNVHDAKITGLAHYTEVGTELNTATFDVLVSYSPLREVYNARVRQMGALAHLMSDPEFAEVVSVALHNSETARYLDAKKKEKEFIPASDLTELFRAAQQADMNKLYELGQMEFIDQYGNEGGQYNVTEEDRQRAKRELNYLETNNFIPESVYETIAKATGQKPARYGNKTPENRVTSDLDMTVFYRDNNKVSVVDALEQLKVLLASRGQSDGFQAFMIEKLLPLASKNAKVILVRNKQSVPANKFMPNARGWTDGDGNVYVLDPSQSHSGLTPELVLHEVMHSVLRNIIDNPRTPEQKATVGELKALYKMVARKLAGTEKAKTFKEALSSLQEFVAYGSTNADFQALLAGIGTKQKNGFTRFVEQVVKLIFPKDSRMSSAALNSALGDLFTHIGELFETVPGQVPNNGMTNGDLLSMASPNQAEDFYTTQQIFDALNSLGTTQEFRNKLQNTLDLVVNRLQGPYGAIRAMVRDQDGKTPLDAWAAAEARGERMFHGKVLAAGIKFSEQEAFVAEQVEAVMSEVLKDKAAANSYVYKEVEKVFLQARDALKGKIDNDLYNFVFLAQGQNSGMGGKSDYMQRFVALALANQEFNNALGFATARPNMNFQGKTLLERLEMVWRAAVDWISAQATGTYLGQKGNERMTALVRKLVQAEVRYRAPKSSMFDFLTPVEERAAKAVAYTKGKVVEAAQSKFVAENRFMAVQTVGIVAKNVAGDRVEHIINGVSALSNKIMPGMPSQAVQLMNYLKGPGQWLNEVVRMAKHTESQRKHITNDVAKSLMNGFKDGGAYLKDSDKKAVTAVLLRTGAYFLNGKYKVEGIQKMLEDPKALQKAIDDEVAQLSQHPEVHYWNVQASGLAWMKVTGWAGVARQNLNAHNMAHLYGTGNPAPLYASQVIPNLERLIALYGLQHAQEQRKDEVAAVVAVMKIEAAQGAQNGIRDTLDLDAHFSKDAKEKLFKDSEALYIHGWMPEVHNPHVEFEIARSDVEAKMLADRGYVLKTKVPVDKNDPDKRPVMLYVIKGAGLPRRNSGAFSFTGTNAKGTAKHNQYYNPLSSTGVDNMISMNSIHSAERAEVQRQFLPNQGFKPGFENRLVPSLNAQGKMVDYRYMMKESLRDDLLERNNDFAHLIGVKAATTFDKVKSREQNKQLAEALHQIYKEDFGNNPSRFVQIGTKSADPEMREIWDLLPSNTKQDINKVWGSKGMWVPKEMVLPLFGYRKYTLSSIFDKDNKTKPEELFTEFSTWLVGQYALHRKGLRGQDVEDYKKRTEVIVRRTEDMWEEMVREMKDIIVVKTGIVLLGNISSNVSLLIANGLNPVKALNYQMEGLRAVMDYQRDRNALEQIKLQLETQSVAGNRSKLIAERNRLEDAIARNPAKELIDAGLLPTIVDDVSMEDDPYSYRSALTNWANEKSAKLNKHVVKAGRIMYMSKDTVMYQFLNKSTQYSDFVARYALFKHETTKKKNPVPKKEALFNVSESFVNYDLPMPKSLQYLDDHGMMNFIKYFFSIQRVLAKLVKEKPVSVINMIALNSMLGDFPIITDSSVVMNIGDNPLGTGALGLPLALPDLMTVDLGTGMFK